MIKHLFIKILFDLMNHKIFDKFYGIFYDDCKLMISLLKLLLIRMENHLSVKSGS